MAKLSRMPIPPMSEEVKKEQMLRAFAQKRADMAEKVMLSLLGNPSMVSTTFAEPDKVADTALKITDELMQRLYKAE